MTTTKERIAVLQRRLDYLDAQRTHGTFGRADRAHRIAAEASALRWALSILRRRVAREPRPVAYEMERDARRFARGR